MQHCIGHMQLTIRPRALCVGDYDLADSTFRLSIRKEVPTNKLMKFHVYRETPKQCNNKIALTFLRSSSTEHPMKITISWNSLTYLTIHWMRSTALTKNPTQRSRLTSDRTRRTRFHSTTRPFLLRKESSS